MGNGEMKLNRYPKYKPTGIAWLPELPEGWEVWPPYASTLSATPHLRVRTVRTEILTRRSGGAESGEIRFAE